MKEEIISEDLEMKSRTVRITEDNGRTFCANRTIRDGTEKMENPEEMAKKAAEAAAKAKADAEEVGLIEPKEEKVSVGPKKKGKK